MTKPAENPKSWGSVVSLADSWGRTPDLREPPMSYREVMALPTLAALEEYVRQVLCQENQWEPAATRLTRLPIRRGPHLCGYFLQLRGPKNLKCHAIWAEAEHRVLFYDTSGSRFAQVRLSEAPALTGAGTPPAV